MFGHDIVVVGASAGGVEALVQLARGLPADLPAAVFVVLHVPPTARSALPTILDRAGPLLAAHAQDGESIEHGRIYVAPPDRHLLIKDGQVRVVPGPRENGHRPAADPLFRTAARTYGPRVVGVVLSGALDDGTAGLQAVKMRGGLAVVQSPDDALFSSMPSSALEQVAVDHCLPATEIPPLLTRLAREPAPEGAIAVSEDLDHESKIAELNPTTLQGDDRPGMPSTFSCRECGGVLWELHDRELIRFRCRVGHAYSAETLLAEQADTLEEALWVALRALEENAVLAHRLSDRAQERGQAMVAERFAEREQDALRRAEVIRQALLNGGGQQPPAVEAAG